MQVCTLTDEEYFFYKARTEISICEQYVACENCPYYKESGHVRYD